ncbi:tRNA pseudouridine(38-40) synthase TruA [Ferrimicrobium sp.]|uniref:tRNA pseudouridine(38-40) synthase TruA n=1 Tax=Ferrimicrobium sp. TaxID=2926050 RepID=UPI002637E50A|nr:tRNA pseudouridine(38-40) synthase TruA [Ferrimicrobium sp.]
MKWALVLAYDGSHFHGSAPQPQVETVVGSLLRALSLLKIEVADLALAGRTDTGVHARFQVVSLATSGLTPESFPRLQAILPEGIFLRAGMSVPEGFHARHSALWRQYRYRIRRATRDPLFPMAWPLAQGLDISAMIEVANWLGSVDEFDALCKANSAGGYRRRLHSIDIVEGEGFIDISVVGVSFCHQMIRRIVGALVQVGRGRWPAARVVEAVGSHDRAPLCELAPSRGLYLWRIGYQPTWEWAAKTVFDRGFDQDWVVIDRLELPFPLEWSAEAPYDLQPVPARTWYAREPDLSEPDLSEKE